MLRVALSVEMPRALWRAWFVSVGPSDSLDWLTFLDAQPRCHRLTFGVGRIPVRRP